MNFKELFFIEKLAVICLCVLLVGAIILGVLYIKREREIDEISYTVDDTLPDGEGKSAKVILLGGQSNAAGCSSDEYLKMNVSEENMQNIKTDTITYISTTLLRAPTSRQDSLKAALNRVRRADSSVLSSDLLRL